MPDSKKPRLKAFFPASKLSSGGIEADDVVAASPRNVRVLAAIPNLYGDGKDAEMT